MKLHTTFARYYDGLYGRKNYGVEAEFMVSYFQKVFDRKPKRVVDFGCGTGRHVEEFVKRGLEAVGVDRSDEMLELARERKGEFVKGDLLETSVEGNTDIVTCLFSSFQQVEKRRMKDALKAFHDQLGSEGLCFLDVHNVDESSTFVNTFQDSKEKVAKITTWRAVNADEMELETVWLVEKGELSFEVEKTPMTRFLSSEIEEAGKKVGFRRAVFFGGWRGQKTTGEKRFIVMLVK